MLLRRTLVKVVTLKRYDSDPSKALELTQYPIPEPSKHEVLVKVYAASLNPIDARIRTGYGKTIFSKKATLPIVLGRDFSGIVIKVGEGVSEHVAGGQVFGVVSPFRPLGMKQGSHAEFVCVPCSELIKKPNNVDHVQAASLPYVALTTYNALITQPGMQYEDYAHKKVFVSAGAGGVGSYAIQFLKALNATVITSCSTEKLEHVHDLGADEVIDYQKKDVFNAIKECDIAYDLLGKSHTKPTLSLLKRIPPSKDMILQGEKIFTDCLQELSKTDETWDVPKYKAILSYFDSELAKLSLDFPKYISIVSPMMPLTDAHGIFKGMHHFISDTLNKKFYQFKEHGRHFNYSFFEPNKEGLKLLSTHIESAKVKPCVCQVFSLNQASEAHKAIDTGHTRGKIVFSMDNN